MADLAVEAGHLDGNGSGRDDELVVRTLQAHAAAFLRTARRHSLCADDAHDAYQRAVEIFLRRAASLRRETVVQWVHTVVKHEAMAVRGQRAQLVGAEEVDLDARAGETARPDERAEVVERTERAAEALASLKPQEVTALWLKAQGLSYAEIAERQAWTRTKVNRCLTEGRRAFLARYAGIESGEECRRWAATLSAVADGEAGMSDRRDLRAHLRHCPGCRKTLRELRAGGAALAGVLPVGLLVDSAHVAAAPASGIGALVERMHHAAVHLHERLGEAAMQLQAAAPAKVAVVAVTAAAVGGTGVVAAQGDGPARRVGRHVRPAVVRSAVGVARSVDTITPVSARATPLPAVATSKRAAKARPRASAPTSPRRAPVPASDALAAPDPAPAPVPSVVPASAPTTAPERAAPTPTPHRVASPPAPAGSSDEFAVDGGG